jgi:hypothetical protein
LLLVSILDRLLVLRERKRLISQNYSYRSASLNSKSPMANNASDDETIGHEVRHENERSYPRNSI